MMLRVATALTDSMTAHFSNAAGVMAPRLCDGRASIGRLLPLAMWSYVCMSVRRTYVGPNVGGGWPLPATRSF